MPPHHTPCTGNLLEFEWRFVGVCVCRGGSGGREFGGQKKSIIKKIHTKMEQILNLKERGGEAGPGRSGGEVAAVLEGLAGGLEATAARESCPGPRRRSPSRPPPPQEKREQGIEGRTFLPFCKQTPLPLSIVGPPFPLSLLRKIC